MTNNRYRGFEVITAYQDQDIHLPQRSTRNAAGYDIEAAETVVIPSILTQVVDYLRHRLRLWDAGQEDSATMADIFPSTLVPTGLKVYMQEDEYLQIINRSSNPLKRNLALPNSIGIIDQDYYNNPENEGHLYVQLINYGFRPYTVQKGERIAQGIFTQYLTVDGDEGGRTTRTGGFGSTDMQGESSHG